MTRSKVSVKVMSPWNLEILPFSNAHLLRHLQCELATDHWFLNLGTVSKFLLGRIFYICPSFGVTGLWTLQKRQLWRVDLQSRLGLIYPRNRRHSRWKLSQELKQKKSSKKWKSFRNLKFFTHIQKCPCVYVCKKIYISKTFPLFSKTFSTLILGSVFNDYVVFYGDIYLLMMQRYIVTLKTFLI